MNTMNLKQKKIKKSLFLLCLQNDEGRIMQILHDCSYDRLYIKASDETRKTKRYWSIFNAHGRFVDGNYQSSHKVN